MAAVSPAWEPLEEVARWMVANEHELEFQFRLVRRAKCRRAGGSMHGYDCGTFVYGATFYWSWLEVVTSTPALLDSLQRPDAHFVVLGSSIGWQVFFAALTFGVPSRGHELLEQRHNSASHVQQRFNVTQAAFFNGDALAAPLTNATAVYLTDLAWEKSLQRRAVLHIAQEAVKGRQGVVVASNALDAPWLNACFENIHRAEVATSWNSQSAFDIHQMRAELSEDGAPRDLALAAWEANETVLVHALRASRDPAHWEWARTKCNWHIDDNSGGQAHGGTVLHAAAAAREVAVLDWVLGRRPKVAVRDDMGCTALHVAAGLGWEDGVRRLVSEGSPKDARCGDGKIARDMLPSDAGAELPRLLDTAG
mmetsp:Transcript_91656/g.210094  ORF Transcript_91656/g.210094 Transcript_91656/m.210094 type:complete len:366 (+) Transcript_91656:2-1099(+)